MPPQRGGRPLYPQQGQPAIYGAHGQPLGNPMHADPNYPPPHGYPMPPPGPYQGAPVYDERGPPQQPPHAQDKVSLKRLRSDESFQPAPPPPSAPPEEFNAHSTPPGHRPAPAGGRRGSGGGYEYPDPTTGLVPVSPASSATSYQSAPYPTQGQPYPYPAPPQPPPQQQQPAPARRSSPQSAYSYDARASGSPHGSTSSASAYNNYPGGLHPPQVLPSRDQGHTPPPGQGQSREGSGNGNGSASRQGMAVRDLLQGQEGGRSSADSNMLSQLNKKGPN
ncbi:hypothetical protein MMC21_006484 [Puttea exsequens]|nr:hypothetical protein [Puttea exsequens]